MKIYGPATALSNDIEPVEEEIYECIRVAHPGFPRATLPEFFNSVDEVAENSRGEEEQCILDTYELALVHEFASDADGIRDVFVIFYKTARAPEGLEVLHLLRLQNPHVTLQKGKQLEGPLYRGERDIERLHGVACRAQQQSISRDFSSPRRIRIFLSFCVYLSL